MDQPLSPETIAIIKATAPALQTHGLAITTAMYQRLFKDEAIKQLFDQAAQASGEQPRKLAAAILAFAQNVDRLDKIEGAVNAICERHVKTHVRPEHYGSVAQALLPAIKEVLGDAATEDILAAWGEAYWYLARIMIERETRMAG
jgi:nitric oxide dioxygenase